MFSYPSLLHIMILFAMVLSSAMRLSFTCTIRFPPISLTTVTSLSTTNPSSARCWRTSSLPEILRMVAVSPAFAIVSGIIPSPPPAMWLVKPNLKISLSLPPLTNLVKSISRKTCFFG